MGRMRFVPVDPELVASATSRADLIEKRHRQLSARRPKTAKRQVGDTAEALPLEDAEAQQLPPSPSTSDARDSVTSDIEDAHKEALRQRPIRAAEPSPVEMPSPKRLKRQQQGSPSIEAHAQVTAPDGTLCYYVPAAEYHEMQAHANRTTPGDLRRASLQLQIEKDELVADKRRNDQITQTLLDAIETLKAQNEQLRKEQAVRIEEVRSEQAARIKDLQSHAQKMGCERDLANKSLQACNELLDTWLQDEFSFMRDKFAEAYRLVEMFVFEGLPAHRMGDVRPDGTVMSREWDGQVYDYGALSSWFSRVRLEVESKVHPTHVTMFQDSLLQLQEAKFGTDQDENFLEEQEAGAAKEREAKEAEELEEEPYHALTAEEEEAQDRRFEELRQRQQSRHTGSSPWDRRREDGDDELLHPSVDTAFFRSAEVDSPMVDWPSDDPVEVARATAAAVRDYEAGMHG